MISTRRIRSTAALTVSAALLVLAAAVPANAAPLLEPGYPIDRGIVTLTGQSGWSSPQVALHDTNETHPANSAAYHVVGTPPSWNSEAQMWNLIQTGDHTYRLINVHTGRALQSTHEQNSGYFDVVTTPAAWNSPYQEFRIDALHGETGPDVVIWGKVLPGYADQMLEVSTTSYLNIPGVFTTRTGDDFAFWTVSGYTFPGRH